MIISKIYTQGIRFTKQILRTIKLSTYPVWAPSSIFLILLLIIPNNKFMGLALLATLIFTIPKTRNISQAIYYLLLLCLPFTKGKGFQFTLLTAQETGFRVPYTFDFDLTFWNGLLILLIYTIIRNRKVFMGAPINKSDVLLVLFIASLIPSTIWSSYPNISALGFMELLFMLLLYFVTKLLKPSLNLTTLSIIISFQLIFEGLWSVAQYFFKRPLGAAIESSGGLLTQSNLIEYAFEQVGTFRSRGTFDHSNTLGSFAIALIPFLCTLLIYKKNTKFEGYIYTLGVILGIAATIVSGSRTSIFITLLFFTALFFFHKNAYKTLFHIKKSIKAIVIGFFALSIPIIIIPRMLQLYITFQEGGGLTYRTNLILYAVQITQNNVLGVGLGLFPKVLFDNIGTFKSYPAQPHNLFAQLGAEAGIIALILFCIFLLVTFYSAIKRIKKTWANPHHRNVNIYSLAALASLCVMLILANVYPFLLRSSIFPYFWILLAILT